MYLSIEEIIEVLQQAQQGKSLPCSEVDLLANLQAINGNYNIHPNLVKTFSDEITKIQAEPSIASILTLAQEIKDNFGNPLMYQQKWFIERMKLAGYDVTLGGLFGVGAGCCWGMSHMAMHAFFADDLKTFDQRLTTIYTTPVEFFADNFARPRLEVQKLKAAGYTSEAQLILDKIVDITAFFDGVYLQQHANKHEDLLGEGTGTKELARLVVLPLKLSAKDITPVEIYGHEKDMYGPSALVCDKEEFCDSLTLLQETLGEFKFSLDIGISGKHSIIINFNPKTKSWSLLDPNYLPAHEYISKKLLVDAIFACAQVDKAAIVFNIFTNNKNKESMQERLKNLVQNQIWKDLHLITVDKAHYFNKIKILRTSVYVSRMKNHDLYDYSSEKAILLSGIRARNIEYAKECYKYEYKMLEDGLESLNNVNDPHKIAASKLIYERGQALLQELSAQVFLETDIEIEQLYALASVCSRVSAGMEFIKKGQTVSYQLLNSLGDRKTVNYDTAFHQQNIADIATIAEKLPGYRWVLTCGLLCLLSAALLVAAGIVAMVTTSGTGIILALGTAGLVSAGCCFFSGSDSGLSKVVRESSKLDFAT
jgi:hypothetical protein